MVRTCNKYGGDEKCILNFSWERLKGRDNLEDFAIDGTKIYKLILCMLVWVSSDSG